LADQNSALDSVVASFFHQLIPLSFLQTLKLHLGWRRAALFWQQHVLAESVSLPVREALKLVGTQSQQVASGKSVAHVLLTGGLRGEIELCGCKVNQSGGAARRMTYINSHRTGDTVLLDLGDFLTPTRVDPPDSIMQLESSLQLELMVKSRYDAIALGYAELMYLSMMERLRDLPKLTSANVPGIGNPDYLSIGGRRIAIWGWMDQPALRKYENLLWLAAKKNAVTFDQTVLIDKLNRTSDAVDGIIVIGAVHPLTVRAILKKSSKVVAVLSTYAGDGGDRRRSGYVGKTFVAFWPHGSQAVGTLEVNVHDDSLFLSSMKHKNLDDSVPDDVKTKARLDRFFNSPEFQQTLSGLDTLPAPNSGTEPHDYAPKKKYAGSLECVGCHKAQYNQWRGTHHATAFSTLLRLRRNHNPDCVRCHVTGFGASDGYSVSRPSRQMENVGCEACHGPGSLHAANPFDGKILRSPLLLTCQGCHDERHSDFSSNPQGYYARAIH
jgi:hypothetical protein